jgi:asparagine synthase (glutamine-hydrolysing)
VLAATVGASEESEGDVCGLAGLVGLGVAESVDREAVLDALHRRGPDSEGVWSESDGSVVLLHRRLAIRDLSPAGSQPMVSASGSHVIAYNGELYALDGLRRRLGARRLRGTSDTEVLVEASAEWGLERVLPELVGMFAFALWDRAERRLSLVRDRVGIKPLYWSHRAGRLAFASDISALRATDPGPRDLDRNAIVAYLRLNHFPAEHTVFTDVHRLRPGEILNYRNGVIEQRRWWDVPTELEAAREEFAGLDRASLLERLDDALGVAVRDRMVTDVPLGVLLSGGIDSTLVTALMVEASQRPVRTFTVGMDDRRFDESARARAISYHLGTEHTEVRLSAREALDIVPTLPSMFSEPFADSSAIPTALVFAHVRPHVTVALSGDGGDEVFAGYPHHWRTAALHGRARRFPYVVRNPTAALARSTAAVVGAAGRATGTAYPVDVSRRLRKAAGVIAAHDVGDAYRSVISQWDNPMALMQGGQEPQGLFDHPEIKHRFPDPLERMQTLDLLGTLPDDILTKVDRASMWSGVEARVPLLDHRVMRLAWCLPRDLRIERNIGKVALRRILASRVPTRLWYGPKRGFGVPLDDWLRGPLRGWAEDLLSVRCLEETAVIDSKVVTRAWKRHLKGGAEAHSLWGVLMLQAWLLQHERARNP